MHDLQRLLREVLIPNARHRQATLVMPTVAVACRNHTQAWVKNDVEVQAQPQPLLAEPRPGPVWPIAGKWREQHVRSMLYPHITFFVEGEAQVLLGVTGSMAKREPALGPSGLYTVTMPPRSWLVVPPSVPVGGGPVGQRSTATASWELVSIAILPMGVTCQSHGVKASKQVLSPEILIPDYQTSVLADFLIAALRDSTSQSQQLAQAYLLALLLRIDEMWTKSSTVNVGAGFLTRFPHLPATDQSNLPSSQTPSLRLSPVEAACAYIKSHLQQPLDTQRIAANTSVSADHLNRLFRAELGHNVPGHVRRLRIAAACSMLEHTNLPVAWISSHFLFSHARYFSSLFTEQVGMSPRSYRNSKRGTPL